VNPVTPQSPRNDILDYQLQLHRSGFYLGSIDGIWGSNTQRAHEAYQASKLPAAPTDNGSLEIVRKGILETANHFLNLTETSQNTRWDDLAGGGPHHDPRGEELRQKLLETGWQLGWAYCIAFAEVCWRAAYRNRPELALISRSITPSVMETFNNFQRQDRITKTPEPGAIMFMQHGDSSLGHAGIVTARPTAAFPTIEGNTSSTVASREGDGVYRKSHALSFTKTSGLWLRGFVNPFLV
jgi:peptidoglycan hydrolase-like protein with peptidoglycan-binding domain